MVIKFIYKIQCAFLMKCIILIGPPGSGKDTQADLLQPYGYFNFSSGQMFRNLDRSTDIGARVGELIDNGYFVPDDLTMSLFRETLERYSQEDLYNPKLETLVLNGIPRTVTQVEPVKEIVDVEKMLYLQVSKDICTNRTARRYKEQGRPEDTSELFDKKWNDFMELTFQIFENYVPIFISGKGTIYEVNELIRKELGIRKVDALVYSAKKSLAGLLTLNIHPT